ncbi:JAB domain-containing protein [Flavobacterium lindanitolerans]|uniref:JAB domain-containing protein n=1 Tax=Flavobacterium lindanitolerans TaxID=428988 RepID=UPI0035948A99
MILSHNHPSGNKKFSESDILLTKKFAEAGQVLDILMLIHVVLTAEGYVSIADEGLLPQIKMR